jgi:tRNA nucleotidyltransferase (CCA-adding enzyme)
LDGTVYDYTGGIEDIKNRRIAFVGDAVERIQEDYLRILRYFRFFGRIARTPDQHEKETIEAIVKCRDGISVSF